ncbi:MAG: O-phosphoserine--tRNA ligase [Candidatus Helarchaeota archaeon]
MKFDLKYIKSLMEKDYEEAWVKTKDLLDIEGKKFELRKDQGKSHVIYDFIEKARKILIKLGFEELVLPVILDESLVYKEYGPEAALILDRLFYLAGLPRPEIGLSKEKINKIRKIIPSFSKEDILKKILREYKIGKIEADDLIETMIIRLDIKEEEATQIIDGVFPEFKTLTPIPTSLTLRSHTTALWFPVLAAMQKSRVLPVQLFHVGPKFRREQQLDKTHLYTSHTISLVIENDEITLEDTKRISILILKELGYPDVRFEIKKGTSKYYAPQTEYEIFIKHETGQWIEIGDGGFYSPVSLAKFGIEYPVFNLGIGVERFAMIQTGIDDIRKLTYPYYYEQVLSDEDIAEKIDYEMEPRTSTGKEIMKSIIKMAEQHKDEEAPVEIIAWKGKIRDIPVELLIWEQDKGAKLLGKASLNEICVKDGSIIGSIKGEGVGTGIRFLDAIAAQAARKTEEMIDKHESSFQIRVKMVKKASELNIKIPQDVRFYITSNEKRIDLKGPVFIGITGRVME